MPVSEPLSSSPGMRGKAIVCSYSGVYVTETSGLPPESSCGMIQQDADP